MRARIVFLVLLGAALAAGPAASQTTPGVAMRFGGTGAVNGALSDGGVSAGLAVLWPFAGPLSFGPEVFADDLGAKVGRLIDPNDGTDLGAVELGHRLVYGGAWRLDAGLPTLTPLTLFGVAPRGFTSATWGLYRIHDDRLGVGLGAVSSAGVGVAAGIRYPVFGRGEVGISAAYRRLFNDDVRGYGSAGLDWGWRWGAGEAPAAAAGSRPRQE